MLESSDEPELAFGVDRSCLIVVSAHLCEFDLLEVIVKHEELVWAVN